jgi:hypothetical protein
MTRRSGAAATLAVAVMTAAAGAGLVTAARGAAPHPAPHAALLTGEYWQRLTPAERQVYLSGFLAGAAAEQARSRAAAAGSEGDSAAVSSGAVAALRAERALHFPFAPAVYSAQVDDFYWWANHRDTPIVDAMIFFNAEMLKQRAGTGP